MLILDYNQAYKILIDELGYRPAAAKVFLENYPPIHPELADAVKTWLQNRTVENVSVFGLSIKEIMEVRGSNFLIAVRDLNNLFNPELPSKEREAMIEILRKPFIKL